MIKTIVNHITMHDFVEILDLESHIYICMLRQTHMQKVDVLSLRPI